MPRVEKRRILREHIIKTSIDFQLFRSFRSAGREGREERNERETVLNAFL